MTIPRAVARFRDPTLTMSTTYISHKLLSESAKARLVCLPYAGGGASVYYRWRPVFLRSIDLLPICLPGREGRFSEPPAADLTSEARSIAAELETYLDRPWAILGHSMGAWLSLEVIRELRRRGAKQPSLLVVAASRAPYVAASLRDSEMAASERPQVRGPEPLFHSLPDDEFLPAVSARFDGIPPSIRENAELLKQLAPTLRADIRMVETYQCTEEPPLDVEILALGGTDDPAVSASELAGWRRHTTNKFSSRFVPGGHFFLFRGAGSFGDVPEGSGIRNDQPSAVLQTIIAKIEQLF